MSLGDYCSELWASGSGIELVEGRSFMVERLGNVTSALNNMAETGQSLFAFSAMVELIIAVIFIVAALVVYFKKLKGQEKKETTWIIVAACLGLIGFLSLIGFILGLLMYVATPVMVKSVIMN